MTLYSVRSDRQFCEQLDYNLLFRWFLDMSADDPAFDASSFSRNRIGCSIMTSLASSLLRPSPRRVPRT